jgi:hypothetical protein
MVRGSRGEELRLCELRTVSKHGIEGVWAGIGIGNGKRREMDFQIVVDVFAFFARRCFGFQT